MKTQEAIHNFRKIADHVVGTLRDEWKDLRHQWAPEKSEATRRFEELKEFFNETLMRLEDEVGKWKGVTVEQLDKLKHSIAELRLQLNLGKAESIEEFEKQKSLITSRWSVLKAKLEEYPEFQQMEEKFRQQLLEWRIRLDLLKVQFALGRMELKENWKDVSAKLEGELQHLGKAVEAGAGIAGEKMDHFEAELKKMMDRVLKKT